MRMRIHTCDRGSWERLWMQKTVCHLILHLAFLPDSINLFVCTSNRTQCRSKKQPPTKLCSIAIRPLLHGTAQKTLSSTAIVAIDNEYGDVYHVAIISLLIATSWKGVGDDTNSVNRHTLT